MVSGVTKIGSIRRARTPGTVVSGGPVAASGAPVPIAAIPAAPSRIVRTSGTVVPGIARAAPVVVVPAVGKAATEAVSGAVGPLRTIVAVSSGAAPVPMIAGVSGGVAPIAATKVISGVVRPSPVTVAGSVADLIGRAVVIAAGSAGPGSGVNPVGRVVPTGMMIAGIGIARRVDTAAVPVERTHVVPTARAVDHAGTAIVRVVTIVAGVAMIAGDLRVPSRMMLGGRSLGAPRIARTAVTAAAGRAVTGPVRTVISARTVAVAGRVRNSQPADVAEIAVRLVRRSPHSPRMCRQSTWIRASGATC